MAAGKAAAKGDKVRAKAAGKDDKVRAKAAGKKRPRSGQGVAVGKTTANEARRARA